MLASMTKRVDGAVYQNIMSVFQGTFTTGVVERGVAEAWVGLCRLPGEKPFWEGIFSFVHHPEIEAEALGKVVLAREMIIRGEIRVPPPPEFGG